MVGLRSGIKHDYLVTWNSILARRAVSGACSRGVGDTFRSRIFWARTRGPSGKARTSPSTAADSTVNPSPILVVALTREQPSPQSLRRLEHEYSLAAELDPTWAARPLALSRHEGRTILILKDPGGEPLDQILEQGHGQPLDVTRVLSIAIGLTTALGQVHRRGLIHKDVKPEN